MSATSRKRLARNAADLLDHLRRVAREVALQNLEDAARMLQRFVAMRLVQILRFAAAVLAVPAAALAISRLSRRRLRAFVQPRLGVVLLLLRIPAGEQAAEIFGVAEVFAQDRGGVGVGDDVVAKVSDRSDRVVDQRAEEDDVAAGAQRQPVCRPSPRSG